MNMTESDQDKFEIGGLGQAKTAEAFSPREIIRQKLLDAYENNEAEWLVEVTQPFSEAELAKIFHENASIFFDELIEITEDNRESDPEQLTDFLNTIHEKFFTFSPSISNSLSTSDMLIISAKVNRVEELRGFVGQNMVGEFVYELTFANEAIIDELISKIDNLPGGVREEVINQLETCFSNAAGDGDWAKPGAERIKIIIDHFLRSQIPLTRIVSQVAQERLFKEEQDPSLGVLTYANNKSGGRVNSLVDLNTVENKIKSNLPIGYRAMVVARDAILGFDNAGTARYGSIEDDLNGIEEQPEIGTNTLKKLNSIESRAFFDINLRSVIYLLGEFREIFMPDKSVVNYYAEILDLPVDFVADVFNKGQDVTVFFQKDWENINKRIMDMVHAEQAKILDQKEMEFYSFNQLVQESPLNPFDIIDKDDITLLTQCLRPEVRIHLEEELGISFSEISFKAEMALIRFISKENNEIYDKLCAILKKYPDQKVLITETFVDCAKDVSLGEKIILLCENLDPNTLSIIFGKYLNIVSQLDEVENILAEAYGKQAHGEEVAKIKEDLLLRGKDLLAHFADLVASGHEISTEEILAQLKDVETDAMAFFLAFKSLAAEGELPPIEEIKGLFPETVKGGDLPSEDLATMKSIYAKNYADMPEIVETVLGNFTKRASDENTQFYVLKFKGKVRGFAGFTAEEGDLHLHSVNVELPLRGMSIGDTLMMKKIDQMAESNIIKAECFTFLPISAKYIETGFVGTALDKYGEHPIINIIRNDKEAFETKQRGKEEFVKEYSDFEIRGGKGECDEGGYLIVKAPTQPKIDMSYLDKGYILTRYFSNSSNDKKEWYAVFEKKEAAGEVQLAA